MTKEHLFSIPSTDKKLFEQNEYVILKGRRGYLVWNRRYPFNEKHSHLYDYNRAKQLIYCAIADRLPPNCNGRFEESFNRITD